MVLTTAIQAYTVRAPPTEVVAFAVKHESLSCANRQRKFLPHNFLLETELTGWANFLYLTLSLPQHRSQLCAIQ